MAIIFVVMTVVNIIKSFLAVYGTSDEEANYWFNIFILDYKFLSENDFELLVVCINVLNFTVGVFGPIYFSHKFKEEQQPASSKDYTVYLENLPKFSPSFLKDHQEGNNNFILRQTMKIFLHSNLTKLGSESKMPFQIIDINFTEYLN